MQRLTQLLVILLLGMLSAPSPAADELVRPNEAFTYTVADDAGELVIDWRVLDGYYLYKKKLSFELEGGDAALGEAFMPRGVDHSDEFFGEQQIYKSDFQVRVPYSGDAGPATLVIKSQGCSDAFGICFPPQVWRTDVSLTGGNAGASAGTSSTALFGNAVNNEFLPPEEAFSPIITQISADSVEIGWQIADGYYLYRDQISIALDGDDASIGALTLPDGKAKQDETYGDTVVYYESVFVNAAVVRTNEAALTDSLTVRYQGCAEDGICYPFMTRQFDISLPAGAGAVATAVDAGGTPAAGQPVSEQSGLAALITGKPLLIVLGTFFGLGLLLSLTPCVLPMVPILSSIITGEGENTSAGRGFFLALVYVLGMALTYTVAGAAFAYFGGTQAQTFFQQPWILITFACLFVVLAMSMFGLFELQMPSAIQTRVTAASNNQKVGTAVGAFVMGALSSLVVTACVAPPLVAALAVIAQTGDVARGSAALFALSMGMGTPLLIVGASAGRLLPKAGAWMETVKQAFGFIMLGVAIYMLSRLLPGEIVLLAWAVLIVVATVYLGALTPLTAESSGPRRLGKSFSLLGMLYGIVLFLGALTGGEDPLQPLKGSLLASRGGVAIEAEELQFAKIKTVADLDRAVADARSNGRAVMLDFYADWCASCKEMEKYTFTDANVIDTLSNTVLLKADVTANDEADQALLKRFGLFGPPSIIFFGPDGIERPGYQVAGYKKAAEFAAHVEAAIAPSATTARR